MKKKRLIFFKKTINCISSQEAIGNGHDPKNVIVQQREHDYRIKFN